MIWTNQKLPLNSHVMARLALFLFLFSRPMRKDCCFGSDSQKNSEGESLRGGGEKRLGRKVPPQNDVGGGRATQDEGSEEALLTSLLFWPQAPRIRLGQTAMTQDEGFEEALFYQPPFLATGTHPPAQALNVSYFSSFLAGITHILGIFVHI